MKRYAGQHSLSVKTILAIKSSEQIFIAKSKYISAGNFSTTVSVAKTNKRIDFFTKKERISCCNADGIKPFIVCRLKISQLQKMNLEYVKEVFSLT